MEFRAEQIEQTFNCNRGKLIQLACLVGSDYTTGIHGIGAVTALEILASFSGQDANGPGICNQSVLQTLIKFRDWWQAHKCSNLPPGSSARLALRKKLKNIELHEGFPSGAVVEAYLAPTIDDNRDAFSWGTPDVESIREFTRKSFGWTTSKTDDILMPVMKKLTRRRYRVPYATTLRQRVLCEFNNRTSANVSNWQLTRCPERSMRRRRNRRR